MGKQGLPRSPRPDSSFGMKRGLEGLTNSDPSIGRRSLGVDNYSKLNVEVLPGFRNEFRKLGSCKTAYGAKRNAWFRKHCVSLAFMFALMGSLFILDSFLVSVFDSIYLQNGSYSVELSGSKEDKYVHNEEEQSQVQNHMNMKEDKATSFKEEKSPIQMYSRLLNLASAALSQKEFKQERSGLWKEPYPKALLWKPCADRKRSEISVKPEKSNGYIMVSANGGLNQQRVAICNAVALASLLNATLVLPRFLYSNVWKDPSQFGDIYQEDHFMTTMKDEIHIVKELPHHLTSVNMSAIGAQITDADIPKEASLMDHLERVLPILLQKGVVHYLGFGNRLGFDPFPSDVQTLRCKCNFHALNFSAKIQQAGSLLVKRIRKYDGVKSMLDKQLLGDFIPNTVSERNTTSKPYRYLALHLRFEEDMIAYSLCDFGGGEDEKRELQAYREIHFPLLVERLKNSEPISPLELRKLGRCPLTPEEAALVLAGLGFKHRTYIYLAGSHIYGGKSRMSPFTKLYPNIVTKETLLTPTELAPFMNFSSQLAALDFIASSTADVFAMTDSGSQLASLVSGYRTYYGGGTAPTLRPNKKRLAAVLSESDTIEWTSFEYRVRKMIEEGQRVNVRRSGRSIYRQPRCPECMCKSK